MTMVPYYYYRFLVDGEITKVQTDERSSLELSLHNTGSKYRPNDFYITKIGAVFILTDNENDLDYPGKGLPLNKALQKLYPNSKITGELILVKLDEDDNIFPGDWNYDELFQYEYREIEVLRPLMRFSFWPLNPDPEGFLDNTSDESS